MKVHGSTISDTLWTGLRGCQQDSIKIGLKYLKAPVQEKSCLLSLPTGAGKSGVICSLSHFSKHKKVLVLCHRRAVCDQLIKQLSGLFFELVAGGEKIPSKEVFSSVDDTSAEGVYVSTFQKLQSMGAAELQRLKDDIDLLIIDEGHSEPSPVWSQIARGLGAHKIIITATPYRNDLFQFDIDPLSSYVFTFEKALSDGILVDPEFTNVPREKIIEQVSILLQDQPGTKCIVKCKEFADVEGYVDLFSQSFRTLGIHDRYTGDDRENVKAIVSKTIAESDCQVIVHQKKLDEGVDIPQAKVLVLTYPVSSGRELVQTVGRVVRLYDNTTASVLEVNTESNKRMWENYREFDTYISRANNAKKFLSSLDTAGLIDSYLSAFPDVSYFESGYKKKFDLKSFDPERSLKIPLASVCFVQKKVGFTLDSMMDRVFWDFSKAGELVERRQDVLGAELILSISFRNSKFLKDELFFQPSFEVFIAKAAGDYVAVFDSRSRDFSYETDLLLGAAVDVDKLLNLANRSDKTRTKEAHTRAISTADRRPEGVSIKGNDLERMITSQGNASYTLTTLTVDNINNQDVKQSSYYLGVGSGRVSDQKKRNFTLKELCEWIDDIDTALSSNLTNRSGLINSYAKPVKEQPTNEPLSVLVDLSGLDHEIFITNNDQVSVIDNRFVLFSYDNGISPLPASPDYKLSLEYDKKEKCLVFTSEIDLPYAFSEATLQEGGHDGLLLDIFNNANMKVLYPGGLSYFDGEFYRVSLPSELGVDIGETKLGGAIISVPELQVNGLTEKDDAAVQQDSFGVSSIFYLIDKLKSASLQNPTRNEMGVFYDYIPNIDFMLCSDMGTEPADFILSSPNKLVFVHVKCGSSANPQSSAGAIAEVGGQAIKNLEMLVSHNPDLLPANRTNMLGKWPSTATPNALQERVRLILKSRFDNPGDIQAAREKRLDEALAVITSRRSSAAVRKEIWIVVGRAFSRGHFVHQMSQGNQAAGISLQAYQLIDGWMATCSSADVDLKIFVSP
ncbi:DEAD/DEAH box helicase [Zhongshania borealis]|uniref:DEAD/DEAH box helicase n=1 Tax=Zhongshania borealis TaxID=889488 RepID=A0ABP7WAL0_9GAMM